MKYRSVVFDMDGVILDFEGDNFQWKYNSVRKVLKSHGVEAENFSREKLGMFMGDQGVKKCIEICNRHELDARTIWEEIAEETSLNRAKKMKIEDFDLYSNVKPTLNDLKRREVRLGLISNAPETAIRETINYFDLKKFFRFYRGIEDFEDLSDRKPHPDHLNFAKAELSRSPYLYIGDHESDVKAAQAAGMDSLWINRDNQSISSEPTYEREDLGGVLDIVN